MTETLLQVDGLTRRFGGVCAVDAMSFDIGRGGVVGLIGPNGAGKTTLFNLIGGQMPCSGGRISFLGQDISRMPAHRRVRMGLVRSFQSSVLYPDSSVIEHVLRGAALRRRTGFRAAFSTAVARRENEAAMQLLALVGLAGSANTPARSLPYGHQRVLGIATALATQPSLIMLDEPVAGMNATETATIAALIARIGEMGITVLLVEHDMHFLLRLSRHVVVMSNGRKIAEGTPEQVRNDAAVIAAYLGVDDDDGA